jgi:hypothetical protein
VATGVVTVQLVHSLRELTGHGANSAVTIVLRAQLARELQFYRSDADVDVVMAPCQIVVCTDTARADSGGSSPQIEVFASNVCLQRTYSMEDRTP